MRARDVTRTVRDLGGFARRLDELGFPKSRVTKAVSRGELVRLGRGWVAVPGADPELAAAARAGVVLTCVTQARRLGLWVLDESGCHVGAPAHGRVPTGVGRVHWNVPPVPRHPDHLVDPVENVLSIVAACQPQESALAIWESALRQQLVMLEAMRRLDLPARARALCDLARPWSDSGLESFIPPRLRWLRLPIRAQIWIAGHRVDFLIGDRLVLQIDGKHHVGLQRAEDVRHDAQLALLGYHVIRVTYVQVVERWHEVQEMIMRSVAQGLHRAA